MREILTEKIKIGEHVLIDGVEYVANKAHPTEPCKGCDFRNIDSCTDFIECQGIIFNEVKKEPKYRPYKDVDEMIADWKDRFNAKDWPIYSMPLIWLSWDGTLVFITGFKKSMVDVEGYTKTMHEIFDFFTYLDGSPCGKEES